MRVARGCRPRQWEIWAESVVAVVRKAVAGSTSTSESLHNGQRPRAVGCRLSIDVEVSTHLCEPVLMRINGVPFSYGDTASRILCNLSITATLRYMNSDARDMPLLDCVFLSSQSSRRDSAYVVTPTVNRIAAAAALFGSPTPRYLQAQSEPEGVNTVLLGFTLPTRHRHPALLAFSVSHRSTLCALDATASPQSPTH